MLHYELSSQGLIADPTIKVPPRCFLHRQSIATMSVSSFGGDVRLALPSASLHWWTLKIIMALFKKSRPLCVSILSKVPPITHNILQQSEDRSWVGSTPETFTTRHRHPDTLSQIGLTLFSYLPLSGMNPE